IAGVDRAGETSFAVDVDFGGRITSVEALAPSCEATILTAATVLEADGVLVRRMLRVDTDGSVRSAASATVDDAASSPSPFRPMVTDGAALYELRTDADGYAIASWPTGC
ncbi:MAG: hypothetical protein KC656_12495, partial [Myxococcales bacterium]|nr:hypothetical protein [Myxococcales bacterium]